MSRLLGKPVAGGESTVSNSIWAGVGEGGRVVTQAVFVLLIARLLGAAPYGRFVATTDFLQLIAPFVWFGAVNLLVKRYASHETSYSEACSLSVATVVLGGFAGSVVLTVCVRPLLLPSIPVLGFVLLACAELIFAGLIETFVFAGLARQRLRQAAAVRWTAGSCRLVMLAAYLVLLPRTEMNLYGCYLLATATSAALALLVARRFEALHLFRRRPTGGQLKTGLSFAFGSTAFMVQDNADKPLMLRLGTATAAGTYEAGYRVVVAAMVPFRAVLQASYARYFRVGAGGIEASSRLARRLLPVNLVYAFVAGAFLALEAPWIASLFGKGFSDTASVLRWLALLPALRVVTSFVGDALTGAGMNAVRARMIVVTALTNIAMNVVLIPRYSWRGAAFATLFAEAMLATILIVILVRSVKAAGRPGAVQVETTGQ